MAGRRSYGEVLREARERQGFDIASMARKLHIRPDILKAIEEADFERTPARGYTRNMVRSYANNLGLDPKRITDLYLSEVHAFETGRPQSSSSYSNGYNSYIRHRETGFSSYSSRRSSAADRPESRYADDGFYEEDDDIPRFERNARTRQSTSSSRYRDDRLATSPSSAAQRASRRSSSTAARSTSSRSRQDRRSASRSSEEAPGRSLPQQRSGRRQQSSSATRQQGSSDRRRASRTSNGSRTTGSASRSNRTSRNDRGISRNSRSNGIGDVYVGGQAPDSRSRSNGYSSMYSSSHSTGSYSALMDKLPFLGIVAAVAIVVIIVLVLLFNGSKQSADNIPDIPISGLTDTSNPEGSINSNVTETAPTEAVFRYAVDDGAQAWIEIYENGSDTPSFAGVVEGPDEQEYKVTDKLVMLTANPAPVHIAVDGSALEFEEDSDSAYYRCEVDFKEILDEWKKEHPTINISSSSSAANA